ncbi:GNAT family N-acetyltransferase [Lapidilactobacillus luobeiensis]|uniref:GNAT family N-acetyltransferase n=1 Tax=Lapidilactobacillus luobeiensis TaxID=2950371 RepID=UPI0021C3982F|nr:GNAT family protein [Lapidilactobacillus luobeiensis]
MIGYQIDSELYLALPRSQDATALVALIQTDAVYLSQWLNWPAGTTLATEQQVIQQNRRDFGTDKSLVLAIWWRQQIVGMISFNGFRADGKISDVGYWLGQGFQGQGIMHRALMALVQIGFTDYQLEKIVIHAGVGNQPSNAVARNAGFKLDGVVRHDELLTSQGWIDLNSYSLLRQEWLAQQPNRGQSNTDQSSVDQPNADQSDTDQL